MKTLRVLGSTLLLQMKQSFVRPMFRFCLIANPILNTILVYEMFRNSGQTDFAAYAILGAGLMGLWGCICFSSAGDLNREWYSGTLSQIFVAPAGFQTILWGKVLGNTLLSLGTLLFSWLTAKLLYGASFPIRSPGYLLLAFLAAVGCFLSVSVLAAWLLTLSRKTTLYMNVIEIPVILICGFVFPAEQLPRWAQILGMALSPTWAVKLLRMAVAGVPDRVAFWRAFGILAAMTALYLVLIRLLYGEIQKQVRIRATLEVC